VGDDAVFLPGDDEAVGVLQRVAAADPRGALALPVRLPIRQDARLVQAVGPGALPDHAGAHPDRKAVPGIDLNTSYSFGLDDQEFVVAFETDKPQDFLDLVQQLRTTESSEYTKRDTPTFTCIETGLARALGALDGETLALAEPAPR